MVLYLVGLCKSTDIKHKPNLYRKKHDRQDKSVKTADATESWHCPCHEWKGKTRIVEIVQGKFTSDLHM